MRLAARKLQFCYIALAKNSLPAREELLQTCSREFAQLYKALHQKSTDGIAWRPKPKMHQLLELCSEPGCDPTTSWCYRDEDAGGPISKVCRMRGRWNNLTYWSEHAFQMFYMKYPLPKIQKHTPRWKHLPDVLHDVHCSIQGFWCLCMAQLLKPFHAAYRSHVIVAHVSAHGPAWRALLTDKIDYTWKHCATL